MLKALFTLVILWSSFAYAGEKWLRLSSSHFEVFTDAGAGNGKEVLRRLEQIRQALLNTGSAQNTAAQSVRIFVFGTEHEFAAYRDTRFKSTTGFYHPGHDRDYIVMRATGPDLYRVVFHEYVHLMLTQAGIQMPLWLNEGTAEFFSTVETSNSQIKIGEVIPQHISQLRSNDLVGLETLVAMGTDSEQYNEEKRISIFYAESWALVHMLNMHQRYVSGFQHFLELLLTGTPTLKALEKAYDISIQEVWGDLRDYVNSRSFPVRFFPNAPLETMPSIEPRQLTPLEAELALADLSISLGRLAKIEPELRELARNQPKAAVIEEALGDVALARYRDSDALAHYRRAIELGSRNARLYFEKAALVRELEGDLKQAILDLRTAIEINPAYQQARELLANMESTFIGTDDRPSSSRAVTRPSVETPKSWQNPNGELRVEGKLVQLDCLGKAARFHVRTAAQHLALYVDDPTRVVLTNAPGSRIELGCGTMPPRDVTVEYVSKPDPILRTAGEITSIRFK